MYSQSKTSPVSRFILLLIALYSLPSWAINLSTGSKEPIRIQADRAELDDKTGQSVYSGSVVITQGKSKLDADQVTIVSDQAGIRQFTATGEPAHLIQHDPETGEDTHAYANTIIFQREKNLVTLKTNARLEQKTSSFQGEEIVYDTVARTVTAQADPNSEEKGRVEIIYQPPKAPAP